MEPNWLWPVLLTTELAAAVAVCVAAQMPSWYPVTTGSAVQAELANWAGSRGLVGNAAVAALHSAWLASLLTVTSGVWDGTAV
ncbi:MAG: hypothetical protein ACLP52_01770 [Streptosporangiaceae bacterium]